MQFQARSDEDDDDDDDDDDDVAETERVYECDLVLLAMGFVGPEKTILEEFSLVQDVRGNIDTSNVKYQTSLPRLYTAGGTSCLSLSLSMSVCIYFVRLSVFLSVCV